MKISFSDKCILFKDRPSEKSDFFFLGEKNWNLINPII